MNAKILISFISIFSLFITAYSQTVNLQPKELKYSKDGSLRTTKSDLVRFRDVIFGVSQKKIKMVEKSTFSTKIEDGNRCNLVYSGSVAGLKCNIYYSLINDRLLMGAYYFTNEHSNKNIFIDDYKNVLSNLTEKYGKPDDEEMVWSNNLYKDDYSQWGFAVSLGHLKCYAKWIFSNGIIVNVLQGDNYDIAHVVRYSLNEYERQLEQSRINSNEF